MFNRILVRRTTHSDIQKPIDLGFLCEAMLFYREVVVLADHVMLKQLVRDLGPDLLAALLENDFLRLRYLPMFPVVVSSNDARDDRIGIKHVGLAEGTETYLQKLLLEKLGKRTRAERKTVRLMRHIKTENPDGLLEQSFQLKVLDRQRLENAVGLVLKHMLPTEECLQAFAFECHQDGDRLKVSTDLDFTRLNQKYHQLVDPAESTLTAPYLISQLISAHEDTYFASSFGAEIASDPLYQKLARLDLSTAVAARAKSAKEIDLFTDFNFEQGRDVKSAINSGARSIDEFLKVLEAGRKFRQWSSSITDDGSLMKEYFRAVTHESWIDKLPAKSARWVLFSVAGLGIDALGAGGLGTAAGMSLSALDQFYLDRILKGWKPNQFIDQLKSFTNGAASSAP